MNQDPLHLTNKNMKGGIHVTQYALSDGIKTASFEPASYCAEILTKICCNFENNDNASQRFV